MKIIKIETDSELSSEEKRLICFVSEKILSYESTSNQVILYLEDDADEQKIIRNFKNLIKPRPDAECEKVIASNILERKYFDSNQILESKLIEQYDEGCIVLSGIAQRVFEYFDKVFLGFIKEYQPISKQFPTLLPLTTVNDTNYLNTSPQYLLFCSKVHESIDEYSQVQQKYNDGKMLNTINSPEFTLSPSACFHLFGYLRKKKLSHESIYTLRQRVFRNEGRLNWREITRLKDYHVREMVMIGNRQYVSDMREAILRKTTVFFEGLGMNYKVTIASDPFVMPTMQNYKRIQKFNQVKYELGLFIQEDTLAACASFNLHGTTFSSRFSFTSQDNLVTESACIGFGIERVVIAFLCQFGIDINNWPKEIQKYIRED